MCMLSVSCRFLGVCSCLGNYLASSISVKITYRMRKEISEKIDKLPLSYFDKETRGEILSRITNDVDILVSSLTKTISEIISSSAIVIGIIYIMFSISWGMTLLSCLGLPITAIFIMFIFKISRKYFKMYQKQLALINGHIEEAYSGHITVKALNGEKEVIKKFNTLNKKIYDVSWKAEFISGFVGPIAELVSGLTYVGLCTLGGYLVISEKLSIGDIFVFFSYSKQLMKPLMSVLGISGTLQNIAVVAERVFEFLESDEILPEYESYPQLYDFTKDTDQNRKIMEIKGHISFENVNFGYKNDRLILKNISLNVPSGKTVAIVGKTGVGKTTLIKLLSGFYEVNGGAILIDGYNIKDFEKKNLHTLFGIVFQEPWLFSGTILENIQYGNPEATNQQIKYAAKLACADSFINSLPDGYETVINEFSDNISQGEKQLLTIARAILANHKILILDEATSSVDTRTEINIQKALKNLLKGRTSFVIAHRLSTIREADIIIVLDAGTICEQGTHDGLLRKKGLYYKMYMSQFSNTSIN